MSRPKTEVTTPQNLVFALDEELKTKTLQEISTATGISTAALSNYSRGIGEPTKANLEKLADYFQVEVEFLMSLGLYRNLGGANKLQTARRFKANVKEKLVFEKFVGMRLDEIAAGDKRSKTALIQFSEDMDKLKAELAAERQELFADLEAAFDRIPGLLKKEAVLRLAELIK